MPAVMNSRERVMRALNYEKADRIGRFDSFWPEFQQIVCQKLGLPADTDLEDYFNIDIHIAVPDESTKPTGARIISEDGDYVVEVNGWGSLMRRKKGGYFNQFLTPAAPEADDFFKLDFDPPDLDSRFTAWDKEVAAEKAKGKCVFGKIGGPYIRTFFVRGEENFLMDIAAEPDLARDMASRMADHLLAVGCTELRRGQLYDTGIWIYDDMGSNKGPMMSPASFEHIFYPAYKISGNNPRSLHERRDRGTSKDRGQTYGQS